MKILLTLPALMLAAAPFAASGDEMPPCALSGSPTVKIDGRPALRLSDVANCPPDSYDILSTLRIDGEPAVSFKRLPSADAGCTTDQGVTVTAEGKSMARLGDRACATEK